MSVCSKQTLKWPRKEGRERCVLVSIQLTCKFQVTTSLRSYEPFFYFGKPEFTSKQLCVHGIWPSLWGHSSTSVGFPVYLGSTTKCLTKTLTTDSFKVVFVFVLFLIIWFQWQTPSAHSCLDIWCSPLYDQLQVKRLEDICKLQTHNLQC